MIQESAHAALGEWETFYLIVGTAAGALTGLQFVVMTLVSEVTFTRSNGTEIDAFGTPTVVHFCLALLISAVLSAPWPELLGPSIMVAGTGVIGLVYTAIIVRRARRQTGYEMVAEDWIWHIILPPIAYGSQVVAGAILQGRTLVGLFIAGGTALLLVFIGIHNAWDTTTFVAAMRTRQSRAAREGVSADGATAVAATPTAATATATPVVTPPVPQSADAVTAVASTEAKR